MKTPLRYQFTEFDCGSVSLMNCIAFLFDREEIPAELMKAISAYTLDCYDEKGNLGQGGTSRDAVKYISKWLVDFSKNKNLGIECEYYTGKDVTFDKIKRCLKSNGCVNFRSYLIDTEHYVTITGMNDDYVYLFDPYYLDKDYYAKSKNIKIIDGKFAANRKISISHLISSKPKIDLSLGPVSKREILLITKK